jgi:ABC-type cobalt transport system substrate-binding protein
MIINRKHSSVWLAVIPILLLTVFIASFSGCRILKRDKQSIADKKAEQADKKATAEYEKARKQHYSHQSKEAKKMMKKTKKNASAYNKPKKRKTFSGTKCD